MDIGKPRRYRFEIAVVALAAALRIAAIAVYGEFERPQLYEYGGIARHILAGKGYAHVFPILHPEYGIEPRVYGDAVPTAFTLPGYVLVMTAVLGTVGDNGAGYATLHALNLLAALLSLVALCALTAHLLSRSAAKWALLIGAVFPPLIAATTTFGGTTWTHLVMLTALLLVVRAADPEGAESNVAAARGTSLSRIPEKSNSIRAFVLAGCATGVWTLFRGEAVGAATLIALWLWKKKDGSLRNSAFFLAACLLVVLPWSLRNTLVFDRIVPLTTNFWLNAWRGNHPGTTGGAFKAEGGSNWLTPEIRKEIECLPPSERYELQVMDLYRARTVEFVAADPPCAALLYARKLGMFVTIDWSDARARHPLFLYPQLLLTLLAAVGAVLLWRRRRFPWPVAFVIVVTMFSVAALHVETRYQLMMGILYIVFAAAALQRFLPRLFPDNESSVHV